MTTIENDATRELAWDKPGPGTWQLDRSHYRPDCSRLAQRAIERGMAEGSRAGFELVGAPVAGMDAAFVNGNFYQRLVPLIGAERDLRPPPNPVLWLATRLHPVFRRRAREAGRAIEERVWNDELARWVDEVRPGLIARTRALAEVDLATLDDAELSEHLARAVELVIDGTIEHFRLHVSDLGPIGLLLVRAREWGVDATDAMAALAGSSPATSAPQRALADLAAAATDGATGETSRFDSLDELRAASPETERLLDEFLTVYGARLTTGYDLQDKTLAELPDVILRAVNAAVAEARSEAREGGAVDDRSVEAAGDRALASLRERVPAAAADELDQLVADARALYGLRDENGPITYQWPAGVARLALLEAGHRLAASGRLLDEAHVFQLEPEEVVAMTAGRDGPSPTEVGERVARAAAWARIEAPERLGPPEDLPPSWTLPPSLARLMEVIVTVLDLIESERAPSDAVNGVGIGERALVGRARVVTDELDALARMEPGDVLVAPFTVPTYNAVLAVAGAVVVENGGLLCHAAVIAREYGIPGLVGATGACSQLPDGALVEVDPVAGTATVVPDR